jgi:hypothetical protein
VRERQGEREGERWIRGTVRRTVSCRGVSIGSVTGTIDGLRIVQHTGWTTGDVRNEIGWGGMA